MNGNPQEADLLALTDVARMLGKSLTGARMMIDRGEIHAFRDSRGRRLVLRVDLEKYLADREQRKNGIKVKLRIGGQKHE
jgi:helix-turn-helix protein